MSLQQIKVARVNILGIVKENKEKHDIILKTAIEGYWVEAETFVKKNEKEHLADIDKRHRAQLKDLRKARKDAIKNLKTNSAADLVKIKSRDKSKGFAFWHGKYPEDHGDDYNGTISKLELCVDNEIELNNNEFDSYIRNKWSWRDSFITSNTGYVTSYAVSSSWCSGSLHSNNGVTVWGSPYMFSGTGSLATF